MSCPRKNPSTHYPGNGGNGESSSRDCEARDRQLRDLAPSALGDLAPANFPMPIRSRAILCVNVFLCAGPTRLEKVLHAKLEADNRTGHNEVTPRSGGGRGIGLIFGE